MKHYFEVSTGHSFVQGFINFEDAAAYADNFGHTLICEVGGCWTEFEKCAHCGQWVDRYSLDASGVCEYCRVVRLAGGEQVKEG